MKLSVNQQILAVLLLGGGTVGARDGRSLTGEEHLLLRRNDVADLPSASGTGGGHKFAKTDTMKSTIMPLKADLKQREEYELASGEMLLDMETNHKKEKAVARRLEVVFAVAEDILTSALVTVKTLGIAPEILTFDAPGNATFEKMKEYIAGAVSDPIEETNFLTWTSKMQQDFVDIATHLQRYDESEDGAVKNAYLHMAKARTTEFYTNLFELEGLYLGLFNLEEYEIAYKAALLSIAQHFAAEHMAVLQEFMVVDEDVAFLNQRAEEIYDLSLFYQDYFYTGRNELLPWRSGKVVASVNKQSGIAGETLDCMSFHGDNFWLIDEDLELWMDLCWASACADNMVGAKLTLQDSYNPANDVFGEVVSFPYCDQWVYSSQLVPNSTASDWLPSLLSSDWKIFADLVQGQMDQGLLYQIERGANNCLSRTHNWDWANLREQTCDGSSKQEWYLDSSVSTRLVVRSSIDDFEISHCLELTGTSEADYAIEINECSSQYSISQEWTVESGLFSDGESQPPTHFAP